MLTDLILAADKYNVMKFSTDGIDVVDGDCLLLCGTSAFRAIEKRELKNGVSLYGFKMFEAERLPNGRHVIAVWDPFLASKYALLVECLKVNLMHRGEVLSSVNRFSTNSAVRYFGKPKLFIFE